MVVRLCINFSGNFTRAFLPHKDKSLLEECALSVVGPSMTLVALTKGEFKDLH